MKNFSFIKNQKIFFGIALAMLVIGVISFIVFGFNVDIDFVGGSELTYDLGKTATKDDIKVLEGTVEKILGKDNLSSIRIADDNKGSAKNSYIIIRTLLVEDENIAKENEATSNSIKGSITNLYADAVLEITSTNSVLKYTKPALEDGTASVWTEDEKVAVETALAEIKAEELTVAISEDGTVLTASFVENGTLSESRSEISKAISAIYPDSVWKSTNSVSAEISADLRMNAVLSTVIAVALMLVYICFRFKFSSALAAIVCLIHDLFIMFIAYSIFQIPVNTNIIAAMLTILGYSINATIIIFDRIRENNGKYSTNVPFANKVDKGIKDTLMRSINTTITTLFTIGMIYLLGVTAIQNFALPLIVGIIAGLFSSVCLAGPLWNVFHKLLSKKSK